MTRDTLTAVFLAALGILSAAMNALADARPALTVSGYPRFPYCQIVDRFPDPLHGAELTGVSSASVQGAKRFGLVETRAWTELGYFRTPRGDVALSPVFRAWVPTGGAGLDLPDAWMHLYLRVQWDLRGYNGLTLRSAIEPGFYAASDALGDGFSLPFSLTAIQSFTDRWSGFFGLKARPSDRRILEPEAGLRFSPTDAVIFDVGYPDTRVWLRFTPTFTVLAGAEWNRLREFALDEANGRDRLRYRESLLYAAARIALDRVWHLEIRSGVVAGREIGYKGVGGHEVEGGAFLTIGVGGVF